MDRRWMVTSGLFGLSCGALVVQSCSSSGSSPTTGEDAGNDVTTSGSSSSGGTSSSSGSSSGSTSSSGSSSGGSSSGDALCAPFDAGSIDPALADAGMQLVLEFRCYSCHQSNALDAGGIVLSGRSTSLSDAASIYPPNLTPDLSTGLGCWTNQQIATALLDGVDNEDASLCIMPRFRSKFADAGIDIDASAGEIIEFLRSLSPVSNQVPETVCPATAPADAGDAGGMDASGG